MREKLKIIVSICVCMCIFTACSTESKFNEEQQQVLADYIAQTVLKHTEGYENKLVDVSSDFYLLTEEEDYVDGFNSSKDNEDLKQDDDNSDTEDNDKILTGDSGSNEEEDDVYSEINVGSKGNLESILGLKKGLEVYVSRTDILKEYASDSYVIDVNEDEKLLKVIFKITNTSKSDVKCYLADSKIKYELKKGNDSYYPLLTALENDLSYYDSKINVGSTREAVLLFRIPDNSKKDDFSLTIKNEDKSIKVNLK